MRNHVQCWLALASSHPASTNRIPIKILHERIGYGLYYGRTLSTEDSSASQQSVCCMKDPKPEAGKGADPEIAGVRLGLDN